MKINGHALGLSLGIMWGTTLMLATILLVVKAHFGWHYDPIVGTGPTLQKIGQFYMGYQVTYFGSIVGFVYGFVHAYITSRIMAGIYNKFAGEE